MNRSRTGNGVNALLDDIDMVEALQNHSNSATIDTGSVAQDLLTIKPNMFGQYVLTQAQIKTLAQEEAIRISRGLVKENQELKDKVDAYKKDKFAGLEIQDTAYTSRVKDITSTVRYHSEIDAKAIMDTQSNNIDALRSLLAGTSAADIVMKAERKVSSLQSKLLVADESLRVLSEEYYKVVDACTKKVGDSDSISESTVDAVHELHERATIAEKALANKTQELDIIITDALEQATDANAERDSFCTLWRSNCEKVVEQEKTIEIMKKKIETMEKKEKEKDRSFPQKKRKTDDHDDLEINISTTNFAFRPARQVPTTPSPLPDASIFEAPKPGSKKCFRYAKGVPCRGGKNCRLGVHE